MPATYACGMPSSEIRKRKQAELDRIAAEISACETCKNDKIGLPVPGEGNPDADIVFIGEAPGKNEAKTGRPFIGRAGKVLREMIASIGLKDEDVFITSPVKYLPVHVTPTPEEVAHGRIHLFEQFAVIQPKVVVLLGRVAALAVLQKKISPAEVRGTAIEQDGYTYFLTYHPAATLYSPIPRKPMEADFQTLKKLIAKMKNPPKKKDGTG